MKINSVISFLFLMLSSFSFAQDGPKVVVFNSPEEKNNEPAFYQNLFKLSPLEAFSGDISFYYERILTRDVSAEIGLGVTTSDYLSIFTDDLNYSDRTSKIGTSFGLGLRYYPFRASEDFYFAPEFKYRYYHNSYTPSSSSMLLSDESRSVSNFRITIGYVYFFDEKIFIDYYGGLGLAAVRETSYGSPIYDGATQTYQYNRSTNSQVKAKLTLGIKFGFVF
jgi:hypothetical protein